LSQIKLSEVKKENDTSQCIQSLQGYTSIVYGVAVLPDGDPISASYDNTLKVWDIKSGQCVMTLQVHTDYVRSVAVLPNGNAISASEDTTLKVWELPRLELNLNLVNAEVVEIVKEFPECKMM
jgi:WD40 repeat protein